MAKDNMVSYYRRNRTMKFIEVTAVDNNKQLIDISNRRVATDDRGHTLIVLDDSTDDNYILVKETYDEIKAMISGEPKKDDSKEIERLKKTAATWQGKHGKLKNALIKIQSDMDSHPYTIELVNKALKNDP